MIKRLVIRDIASYDKVGVTFENLQKVNFIYGGNGTGKTTLSRVLEHPQNYPACHVEWDGKPVDVLVYNQDFKRRNLKETMPGVFTIGDVTNHAPKKAASIWTINKRIQKLKKQCEDKSALEEIEQFEKDKDAILNDVISIQPVIDNINRMLRMIGFTGFSIQKSTKDLLSYQIQREDGSLANETLSEGEVTFITFLYFIQLVYGGGKNIDAQSGRVVVIDDPISSLDADVMFVVSEMVQSLIDAARGRKAPSRIRLPEWTLSVNTGMPSFELTWPIKGVVQVFVMTHNVYFYKQVTEHQCYTDIHYWKLRKRDGISKAIECGEENPIRSEYELLWREIRMLNSDEDSSVNVPNVMRRIIETYFVVMGGYNKRKLIPDNFSNDPEELTIVNSLAKWADEGSHRTVEELYASNGQELNEKYLKVFKRLFEALGHEAHYKMMMREEMN